jgi:hypothetical protein
MDLRSHKRGSDLHPFLGRSGGGLAVARDRFFILSKCEAEMETSDLVGRDAEIFAREFLATKSKSDGTNHEFTER